MALIVAVGVFLASFTDAIAGGGGIISVPTYLIAGLPAHYALGTNKLSAGLGTIASTGRFIKNGYVDWKLGVPSIVLALVGSHFGTKLQLKPIIVFGENGEIQVVKKCMGSKRAMRDMTEMVTECRINPEYPVIPIFAQNDRNCQEYVASLKNAGCVGAMQVPQGIGATISDRVDTGSYLWKSERSIVNLK